MDGTVDKIDLLVDIVSLSLTVLLMLIVDLERHADGLGSGELWWRR